MEAISAVDRSVVPWFRAAAAELLAAAGSPEEALAMALAKVTGHSTLQVRPPGAPVGSVAPQQLGLTRVMCLVWCMFAYTVYKLAPACLSGPV